METSQVGGLCVGEQQITFLYYFCILWLCRHYKKKNIWGRRGGLSEYCAQGLTAMNTRASARGPTFTKI